MKSLNNQKADHILFITKLVIKSCLMVMLLTIWVSYAAYADDLAVSAGPWKISALLAVVCSVGPLIIYLGYRGTNALWAYGLVWLIGIFSGYYFSGIMGYFYFFIFAPMTAYLKWPGLVGGILLTACWVVFTYRNAGNAIRTTSFVECAFDERGNEVNFQIQQGMREFERYCKELNPFPKLFMYIIYGIAPFYLILNRILSSNFGTNGVLLFVAALCMPISLWFAGVLVRGYLVTVALPLRIERERHKRVVVIR